MEDKTNNMANIIAECRDRLRKKFEGWGYRLLAPGERVEIRGQAMAEGMEDSTQERGTPTENRIHLEDIIEGVKYLQDEIATLQKSMDKVKQEAAASERRIQRLEKELGITCPPKVNDRT